MDSREAEIIFEAGKEVVIEKLLEMNARILSFEQKIQELEKKIASLTTNSTNSSKPPSTDPPQVQRPRKDKSSRHAGGQKGHQGHKRELLPVEEMDRQFDHYPDICEQCAAALDRETCRETSAPTRYQIFELPEIKPVKTESPLEPVQAKIAFVSGPCSGSSR